MNITIAKSKRFGFIPLGNPSLRNYVKHEYITEVIKDKRCFALTILEVRHKKEFCCLLDSTGIKVRDKTSNSVILSSSCFDEKEIEKAISDFLSSNQIKLKLMEYSYKQD